MNLMMYSTRLSESGGEVENWGNIPVDYNKKESASDSRCMHAFSGRDAQLANQEVSRIDITGHHLLGYKVL